MHLILPGHAGLLLSVRVVNVAPMTAMLVESRYSVLSQQPEPQAFELQS